MSVLPDLRSASALLRKAPGFSLGVILILALGLGAGIGVFSILNDVFLRPPGGVHGADRLVVLRRVLEADDKGFSHLGFLACEQQASSFSRLLAYRDATALWRDGPAPVRLEAALVTEHFFTALGVRMAQGRDFLPEEHRTPGTHPVAIVSHRLWRSRFNSDPALVGRALRLGQTAFTVVGIAPAGFGSLELSLGGPPDLWLPLMMEGQVRAAFPTLNGDSSPTLRVIGQLRPGVDHRQAAAELAVVTGRIEKPEARTGRSRQIVLYPHLWFYRPAERAEAAAILALLHGIVGLVLVISCANVANLFLARTAGRRKEIAVRLALGASPGHLIRQLTAESLLLAALGVVPGLGIAWAVAGFFWNLTGLPVAPAGLDGRIAAFAVGLAALVGVACGLLPAWRAVRRDPSADLKAGAGQSAPTRSRLRTTLLLSQVAASLMLLHGAGLFVRTLQNLSAIDFGFPVESLLVVRPDLSLAEYSTGQAVRLHQQLGTRLAALPGVQSVTRAAQLPRRNNGIFWGTRRVVPEGRSSDPGGGAATVVEHNEVGPDYFATLGVALVRGREFAASDTPEAPGVVIVNETLAHRLWPGEDPLGRRVQFADSGLGPPLEVIGVARDLRTFFREEKPAPQIYHAIDQTRNTTAPFLVRAPGAGPETVAAIQREQHRVDPALPPATVESLPAVLADRHGDERIFARLAGLFGGAALALAAFGLYSVLACLVVQRTREIGVRLALGAQPSQVLRMVVRQGLSLTAAGIALGLAVDAVLLRVVAHRLHNVNVLDPLAVISSAAIVLGVALFASWLPARHAARVDPLVALRTE